ncbi:hypothetical protein SPRG_05210 [Saprolegnia parasitica CBS 223.65]|uniref:Protein ENHANCED DISEASE RESISTANCE 2 C-terminal domain-containing protein n=1 Tax=Saprolegnia parasitica (strain CBS 223.65) TaxID=695850 RepID=A0A067CLC4_SAPPC|nr:hypothetical protein SPRG_05210 [Saprolegnia parasitica CBS 223.65]KDO30020.1 hypothetical protein SPRG_05210 [Saprolegnia parasitica CBS 223.65]|eukprot:XP_012199202.1 hypothetical protein SPRG_05210 [Saprolegnia parasitica CBS 223.65]
MNITARSGPSLVTPLSVEVPINLATAKRPSKDDDAAASNPGADEDAGSTSRLPTYSLTTTCADYWKKTFQDRVPQHGAVTSNWREPSPSEFRVRSKKYLTDSVKEAVDHPKCDLVWVDVFQGKKEAFLHAAARRDGVVSHFHALYPANELFVLNIILPGKPEVTYVNYFALRTPVTETEDSAFGRLWRAFLDGSDEFRNARLKLIPRIVHGPWMVRKAVGSKPFILAKALPIQWFRGKHYLEAVVDVSSDAVARKVTSMCRMCVSSLTVDIGLLPEAMLGCVQYDRLDMANATPI